MQFRNSPEQSLRMADVQKGQVEIDVVPYNVLDDYQTRFAPGVFSESLARRQPPMCWGHDWRDPIGHPLDFDDQPEKLRALYQLDNFEDVPRARQAYAQIKSGTIRDTSFGFDPQDKVPTPDVEGAFDFTRAKLNEVSPVLIGAVPGAQVTGIRGVDALDWFDLARQLERKTISLEEAERRIAELEAASGENRAYHSHAKQDGSGTVGHSHAGDLGMHAHSGLMPVMNVKRARDYDPEQVRASAKYAMGDGSYPISTCADVSDAAKLAHHSKTYSFAEVKAHVMKAKNALNCPDSALPDSWRQANADEAAAMAAIESDARALLAELKGA